jgi:hypothetical protein
MKGTLRIRKRVVRREGALLAGLFSDSAADSLQHSVRVKKKRAAVFIFRIK